MPSHAPPPHRNSSHIKVVWECLAQGGGCPPPSKHHTRKNSFVAEGLFGPEKLVWKYRRWWSNLSPSPHTRMGWRGGGSAKARPGPPGVVPNTADEARGGPQACCSDSLVEGLAAGRQADPLAGDAVLRRWPRCARVEHWARGAALDGRVAYQLRLEEPQSSVRAAACVNLSLCVGIAILMAKHCSCEITWMSNNDIFECRIVDLLLPWNLAPLGYQNLPILFDRNSPPPTNFSDIYIQP